MNRAPVNRELTDNDGVILHHFFSLATTTIRDEGLSADTLSLVKHLSYVLSWLKTRNKLYILCF
jgi:hypothetical protein